MRNFIAILYLAIFLLSVFLLSVSNNGSDEGEGNSYTVNRFGNITMMSGFNGQTGSQWSQNSQTFGNSTFTNGMTNGRPWSETQQNLGGGNVRVYGMNSAGRPYSLFCNPYSGCK